MCKKKRKHLKTNGGKSRLQKRDEIKTKNKKKNNRKEKDSKKDRK